MLRFFCDSDSDVTLEIAKKYGCDLISYPYEVKGELIYPYVDFLEYDVKGYFKILRGGYIPTTSALNEAEFTKAFEPAFAAGDDIIYVHYSRGMSASFNNMDMAVAKLQEKYPGVSFYEIDTKAITIGSLAPVLDLLEMWKNGADAQQLKAAAEEMVPHYATYFFADDLKFFRKSGRVSGLAGIMGNFIGIKPIIHMNDAGEMKNIGKVKGTKNALKALVDYVDQLKHPDFKKHRIVIAHGDAEDLANKLVAQLKEKFGDDLDIMVGPINPTAAAHCGPDTIGVTFYAIHR